MPDHDPLCPHATVDPDYWDEIACQCDLIDRVIERERERIATGSLAWVAERTAEKIAQAIEAYPLGCPFDNCMCSGARMKREAIDISRRFKENDND
jgi:hypothetical protein